MQKNCLPGGRINHFQANIYDCVRKELMMDQIKQIQLTEAKTGYNYKKNCVQNENRICAICSGAKAPLRTVFAVVQALN